MPRFEDEPTWTTLKSEASFASRCFGVQVEAVEILTESGASPQIIQEEPRALYYDDRTFSTSVRTASAGLPGSSRR